MTTAHPYTWAETAGELDAWKEKQVELMKPLQIATITFDSGNQPCRLVPIFPTVEAGKKLWWPLPMSVVTAEEAYKMVADAGLQYDRGRKSKVGYQRGLKVSIS